MKPLSLAVLAAIPTLAHADLVITEVMPDSLHPTLISPVPDADGDWWELTNTGTADVNLTGYKWDDTPTPATPTVSIFPPGIIIKPGESIIILEEPAANVSAWKSAWGLGASVQVIDRTQFSNMGGEGFSGLSLNGDEINLYDAADNVVAQVSFGAAIAGRSLAFHRDGFPIMGGSSVAGKHGAVESTFTPKDVGSPGDAGVHFTSSPKQFAQGTYLYEITAEGSGSTSPTFTATGLPSFLTLTDTGKGTATLASNRNLLLADAGNHTIQITATSGTKSTVQEFVLAVVNPLAPIILNEYNAVSSSNYLNGGNSLADDDGAPASKDSFFNRVAGNGGQWVEFVVVGTGSTGNVDMRGWTIEIGTNTGSGFVARNTLVLSNSASWQTVPVGTILTFTDKTTAQGGQDSKFAIRDRRGSVGDVWTNIWMGDTTFLTYTSLAVNGYTVNAGVVSGILIDQNATQFRVKNSTGAIVSGPVGEGVAPRSGTNSKEVFELEGHPTPSASPLRASTDTTFGYDDGASESTFGLPNNWLVGTTATTQKFTTFNAPEINLEIPAGADLAENSTVDFGKVSTGKDRSLTFTIANRGTSNLTGLAVTIDGTDASNFTVTTNATAPVAAGATTTFTLKFAPTTNGSKTAAIHIASNDDDEALFDLNVTGTGAPPESDIEIRQPEATALVNGTSSKAFGSVQVGATKDLVFTVNNTGTEELSGLAATIDGTDSSQFSVTTAPPATVAAEGTTTFTVRFAPSATGAKSAVLHVASNDPDEAPFDIALTGTGFVPAPEITVQQPKGSNLTDGSAKIGFGKVKVNKAGTAKTFTIKNLGTANLTGLAITKNGKNAGDFIVTSPGKATLAPGASTTFKVTFKPGGKGARSAAIHVKSNASNENPYDINLSGTGI
jgi:uncharacterized cupredoxin-like copper-binding protein